MCKIKCVQYVTVFLCLGNLSSIYLLLYYWWLIGVKKVKECALCKLFMEIHLTATECHLPYGIIQCYLPPDTSENTPPLPQPDRLVLDLPTI